MNFDAITCGERYNAIATWALANHYRLGLFAAGFIAGQAEKVYLNTYYAAMIRPAPEWQEAAEEIVTQVCHVYDLRWMPLTYGDTTEYWLYSADTSYPKPLLDCLVQQAADYSPHWSRQEWAQWHLWRADLCGVSAHKIDTQYHARPAYGARCEPEGAQP